MRAVLESLLNLADASAETTRRWVPISGRWRNSATPSATCPSPSPPFDMVSDFFRGLRGGSLDIYRNPDKLLAAVETHGTGVHRLRYRRGQDIRQSAGLHPHAPGGRQLHERGGFREVLLAELLATDRRPHRRGAHTGAALRRRLQLQAQVPGPTPPGKVAAHFDHIDRKKFKEMCGDVMCFWGNVPASLLCTGTPQQVKDDVRELIELFGDTGALIIDSNQGIPDEARPENVLGNAGGCGRIRCALGSPPKRHY